MLKNDFLKIKDFDCIGDVARHCDHGKLDIAVKDAFEFDLKPLLCGLFWSVSNNWFKAGDFDGSFDNSFNIGDADEAWGRLVNGSMFIGCNDIEMRHRGLKTVLAYYAYARYLIVNGFDDTPNGPVQKQNDWSLPKPMKEVQLFSNQYRNKAKQTFEDVEAFICLNKKEWFSQFNSSACVRCGCNGVCGIDEHNDTRFFGLSGGNVTKH